MTSLKDLFSHARNWRLRDLLSLRLLLIILWLPLLRWGELTTFSSSVVRCDWGTWEKWPSGAAPHRVVLVADPQLVDPHTYPGRPWPLSSLTVKYTDLYLRKGFGLIMEQLQPDSVFFLGDLFDGGREWSPPDLERDPRIERRWRKYGQKLWMREYRRFGELFTDQFFASRQAVQTQGRFVASLPGNHDLGLGKGIRIPVRERFYAYFGEGNRIDIVGNYSFIGIDSVSLSAKGQPDPATGVTADTESGNTIWESTEQFLREASSIKSQAVARYLRTQNGGPENDPLDTAVYGLEDPRARDIRPATHVDADVPSILLTHIPLYRSAGTPCGPLRERHPPSKLLTGAAEEKDDANALLLQTGNQYQNVLTAPVSDEIIDLVPDIVHVFSGDDHDYCDVLHRQYTSRGGGIREITVKSISWAMGIRKPGFLMLSLWNPLDAEGKAITTETVSPRKPTLQTHLCLLPDQLGIFVKYAWMFAITVVALLVRSVRAVKARPVIKGTAGLGLGGLGVGGALCH
ncbi:uncharacterized protein KY384_008593 [Bacidia gigantensis]|uniref:uncharacterized protein n=1 Tax=Bacidia gigantensis TaxID=2732470 RepID=UPI001D045F9A|nr:uncharacterized protein KY384_008593 [Bacidia gigantensis]KAG8527163.1 hypothetical protein KY384_008593 [Bacidia gigantensis]